MQHSGNPSLHITVCDDGCIRDIEGKRCGASWQSQRPLSVHGRACPRHVPHLYLRGVRDCCTTRGSLSDKKDCPLKRTSLL
jgi:hypothetical protein